MILADWQIRNLGQEGLLVDPFDESLVNPASLDVRLGPNLMVEVKHSDKLLTVSIEQSSEHDPFLLDPGQFVLGETMETFNMPSHLRLAAQFALKSSRAREGIEHLMAGYVDPGFNGSKLTLELVNARKMYPVRLWKGMKIGQMVFHRMEESPLVGYEKTGHYNGIEQVAPSWETWTSNYPKCH